MIHSYLQNLKKRPQTIQVFFGLQVVLLIVFFLFPFLSIGGVVSGSAGGLPISLFNSISGALNNIDQLGLGAALALEESGNSLLIVIIYMFTWYLIPIMSIISCIFACLRRKNKVVVNIFQAAFIVDIITVLLVTIIRLILLKYLDAAGAQYGMGTIISGIAGSLISFKFGYYCIWLIGIAGIALRYIRKYIRKNRPDLYRQLTQNNQKQIRK